MIEVWYNIYMKKQKPDLKKMERALELLRKEVALYEKIIKALIKQNKNGKTKKKTKSRQ